MVAAGRPVFVYRTKVLTNESRTQSLSEINVQVKSRKRDVDEKWTATSCIKLRKDARLMLPTWFPPLPSTRTLPTIHPLLHPCSRTSHFPRIQSPQPTAHALCSYFPGRSRRVQHHDPLPIHFHTLRVPVACLPLPSSCSSTTHSLPNH